MNDIVGTVDALNHIEKCYLVYGKSVNTDRALPSAYDGLKPVQRRILLTLKDMPAGLNGTQAVVGNTMRDYHPHGDSSVSGAIVNLVNKMTSPLIGKGNFGSFRTLDGWTDAAAARYTKVGLSDAFNTLYKSFIDQAPSFINENDHEEQYFLPTIIPFCLLNGDWGIGVGCATKIPPCDHQDLLKVAKLILEGKDEEAKQVIVHPVPQGGKGSLEITDEQLIRFNTKGECSYKVSAKVESVWDGRQQFIITDFPDNINPAKLKTAFKYELEEGLVWLQDESSTELRIVIGRESRIKRITDEEIESRIKRATTLLQTYKLYVAFGDVAKVATPYEMIKASISKLLECVTKKLDIMISKLNNDILFEKYKQEVAKVLINNNLKKMTPKAIRKEIPNAEDLTDDIVKFILSKPISSLMKNPKDTEEMISRRDDLIKYRKVPNEYYLKYNFKDVVKIL